MSNNRNSYDYKNRNLSDVFKELQSMQHSSNEQSFENTNNIESNTNYNFVSSPPRVHSKKKSNDLKLSHIIVGCSIIVVSMALFFPKNTSFNTSYARLETSDDISEYEVNRHSLNMQNIISENAGIDKVKEQTIEERDVEFETTYNDMPTLPKREELLKQEGILGKNKVTVVKTYENGDFVEEIILAKEKLLEPVPKLIDLGTSEFLAKHKVHLGDTMYFVTASNLKESADTNSADVAELKQSLDVK